MKGGEPTNSVYRSGQTSFNSRPTWTELEVKQGILERFNWDGKLIVRQIQDSGPPRFSNLPARSYQEHLNMDFINSYIREQAISSTTLVKSIEINVQTHI